jgi:hypothetical protein
MLNNDACHQWSVDADLGQKISRAMNYANDKARKDMASVGGYGRVVECTHADCQTLAMMDGYTAFTHVDSQSWVRGDDEDSAVIRLLRSAAKKLGYRLVKNPAA